MQFIGQKIFNETNLLIDDRPHHFKNFIDNPSEFVTWDTIEDCLNKPELFNFELISKDDNNKIEIPKYSKSWVWDHTVQDKPFLFDNFNKGHGLVIMNYGFYNRKTMELLNVFEQLFDVNAAIHVYCGLEDSASFPIHDDYPVNFIIQVEGKTRWKVFENRISYLHRIGTLNDRMPNRIINDNDLRVAIDVELEPGDALYIPSRCYHVAYPKGKRISMSIPCWVKYPNDPATQNSDRNWYSIRRS